MKGHDHHDNALTFGCAGCIELVRLDQEHAALQEELDAAPLRDVRVTFIASWSVTGEVILRTPIPDHWDEGDVRDYFSKGTPAVELEQLMYENVQDAGPGDVDFDGEEFEVRDAPTPPPPRRVRPRQQLDLFGPAA